MLWLVLSLATALAVASQDAWVKRHFSEGGPFEMAAVQFLYSLPPLGLVLTTIRVPPIGPDFGWSFAASFPLNGVAFLLYMRAIRRSPLSLTVPYLAFTPVFMILTGYLFLGEVPGPAGAAGIATICAGGYTLNVDPHRFGLLEPIRAIFRESGSWTMLIVAFIYSFASVIGKRAILASSPMFFSLSFFVVFNGGMLLLLILADKVRPIRLIRQPGRGAVAGLLFFLHAVCHGWAISLTQAAYMIAVKRLSIVFSVAYAKFLFREENLAFRFGGAVLMVAGTALIALGGG